MPAAVRRGTRPAWADRDRRPPPVPVLDRGSLPADGGAPATTVYAFSAMDKSGRIADRSPVQALGWQPGTRLHIREQTGVMVATAAADGVHCLDRQGHLHLPIAYRRWCHLRAGDRLLLSADLA